MAVYGFAHLFTGFFLTCLIFSTCARKKPHQTLSGTPGLLLRDLLHTPYQDPATGSDKDNIDDPEFSMPPPPASLEDIRNTLEEYGLDNQQYEKPSAQFLIDLYNQLQRGIDLSDAFHDGDVTDADTVRSFEGTEVPSYIGRSEVTLTFNLSSISTNEKTQLAELKLKPVRHHGDGIAHRPKKNRPQKMRVTLLQNGVKVKHMVYRVNSQEDDDGSRNLDLTRVVRDIVNSDYRNCTIEITIKYKKKDKTGSRTERAVANEDYAMLVVFSQDKHFFSELKKATMKHVEEKRHQESNIQRRSVKPTKKSKKERGNENETVLCNKRNFYVDFDTIGWGQWIVYPKRFNAYLCGGRCPLPVDQIYEPTNHAVMQSLMRIKSEQNVPRPCCVPSKLQPLSMLYYEYGEIVVRHHEDMIVEKCGCK